MKTRILNTVAVTLGLFITGETGRAEEPALVADIDLQAAGLVRYWEARLPFASQETIVNGFLVDDALYVTTSKGILYALDAAVGLIRWAEQIAKPGYMISEPAHLANAGVLNPVVVPTSDRLYVFGRYSGKQIQSFDYVTLQGTTIAGLRDRLFMAGKRSRLCAFRWVNVPGCELSCIWDVAFGAPIGAGPILFAGPALVVGTRDGYAAACLAEDKRLLWSTRTGGSFVGKPALDEIGVFMANENRALYKLNLDTGAEIWRMRFQNPLSEGPVVAGHTVYQFCSGYGITAIDADTGREKWQDREGRTLAAYLGDRDLLLGGAGRLKVNDHEKGTTLATVDAARIMAAVPNGRTEAAYLLAADGRVLCVRPGGTPYLKLGEVAAARNSLQVAPEDKDQRDSAPAMSETSKEDASLDNPFRSKRDLRP